MFFSIFCFSWFSFQLGIALCADHWHGPAQLLHALRLRGKGQPSNSLTLSHLACFAYSRKNGRSFCYPTLLVNNCLICMETPEADFMMYNFVEVSAHNLASSQTWGFRVQCLHYSTNQFQPTVARGGGGGGGVKWVIRGDCEYKQRRKTLKTVVPITSKNSASV